MQPNLFPFGTVLGNPFLFNGDLSEGFESSRVFFLVPFLLFQGGGMDLSKVGEKILSSVRSARSLGLLPSTSDRPEVPARVAAAAAVAHALAGLPPHQRFDLPSSSEGLRSIYGIRPSGQVVEELEEDFYGEDFDPIRHVLENIPSDENDLAYFEKQAALRLAQLDKVAESLSHHVMEHHEVMVKGMNLVRELEKDLKIANVICMNGRRHLNSSMNEVSRDLIVNSNSKKKQALLDMLPVLTELRHAVDMQVALESLVEEGNYCKAFQVLSEYLQILDSFSELSAMQEMSRGVEVWLGKTLQKLDSLLLGVCQEFKEEGYLIVVDAYALIGDVSGLAEKIQSFFMQEVLSETHSVLKNIVQEDQEVMENTRLTYSDLCLRIPESKFRQCLLATLAVLFKLMCSYYEIMGFQLDNKALKMVLEKENWQKLPPDTVQVISFPGLLGDGAPIIVPSAGNSGNARVLPSNKSASLVDTSSKHGFLHWLESGNPFLQKAAYTSKEGHTSPLNGTICSELDGNISDSSHGDKFSPQKSDVNKINGSDSISEDENEDLLADFIDEDSQLPSRISKPNLPRSYSSHWKHEEITAQTGSSVCLLRSMDKYARLMQKLEIVNIEFFKGVCQLFGVFFYFVFETFGQQNPSSSGKSLTDSLNYRLKTALSRITQDCDQWIKYQSSSPTSLNASYTNADVTPMSPSSTNFGHFPGTSFGLKERCAGADSLSLVAQVLHRSKAHLQSMLLQKNGTIVDDFYVHLVDAVPFLVEHTHRTTAKLLLNMNGYVDRIANAKWEVKELGLEHNGYVDLLLGEFKHYKTRVAHGGIRKEVQDHLLEYGVEIVAETLIEGLSRVKRCTDEGRALMSLDLQVLINGLQHFVSVNVRPQLQMVETFIKAYYLPETEYVHWARGHPEYSKSQIVGLINLVATMKGWKRKNRLDVLEKIE